MDDRMEDFAKSHEWISVERNVGTVGITKFAAEQLGDIVVVEVPAAGRKVKQGDQEAVVNGVKAASDIYAPVSGEINAVNEELISTPAGVSESPEAAGWFFMITDKAELASMMDRAAYKAFFETA